MSIYGGSPLKHKRNLEIRRAVARGEPLASVARCFGVSRQRVDQIVYPERKLARKCVENALVAGKLVRPAECERCGRDAFVQAHHKNYTEPMVISWLCVRCHVAADKRDNVDRQLASAAALSALASELADA